MLILGGSTKSGDVLLTQNLELQCPIAKTVNIYGNGCSWTDRVLNLYGKATDLTACSATLLTFSQRDSETEGVEDAGKGELLSLSVGLHTSAATMEVTAENS